MSFLDQYHAVPPADVATRIGLVTKWIRTDGRAFFAELRHRQPVFRTPKFTFVTRYRDVTDVLRRNDVFSVRIYQGKMDAAVGPHMLGRDDAIQNYRDKSLLRTIMRMEDLGHVADLSRAIIDRLLSDCDVKVDVVKQISRTLPVRICDEYFGFPGPDEETMKRWGRATQADFFKNVANDPAIHAAAVQAGQEMKEYLPQLIEQRRAAICRNPDDDLTTVVDRLVHLDVVGQLPMSVDELVTNIAGLLIGAVETTSQAIAQALEQILIRPAIRAKAIELAKDDDEGIFADFVLEALRFNPINPLLFRFTESPTTIGAGTDYETRIDPGEIIFACTSSAMWDESFVDRPDEFRPGRPKSDYLSFGYGDHECLGKMIGEVMTIEAVRSLLAREAQAIDGPEGKIDFAGGPFPESYSISLNTKP